MTANRSKLLIIAVMFAAFASGVFFRFHRLAQTPVWDIDVSLYSTYAHKYHELFKVVRDPQLRTLIRSSKASGQYETFEELMTAVAKSSEFAALTKNVPATLWSFPTHAAKPAFIMMAALFECLYAGQNSVLFLTAVCGLLLILIAGIGDYLISKNSCQTALVVVLLAISPMLVGYSRIGYANGAANVFLLLGLLIYYRSFTKDQPHLLLAVGLLIGVAIAFHPVLFYWGVFAFVYEFIACHFCLKRIFLRVAYVAFGFVFVYLCVEVFHLTLAQMATLIGAKAIHPYWHSLVSHVLPPEAAYPLYYLEAVTLYEGVIFVAALLASAVYFMTKGRLDDDKKFWLYFMFVPLIVLSIFSDRIAIGLRNLMFITVPAYFVLARFLIVLWKRPALCRQKNALMLVGILMVAHGFYAVWTNLDNANIDAGAAQTLAVINAHPEANVVVPESHPAYIQNLTGKYVDDEKAQEKIYFYRQSYLQTSEDNLLLQAQTNIYDKKIFAFEHPIFMRIYFDEAKKRLYNRVFVTRNPISF